MENHKVPKLSFNIGFGCKSSCERSKVEHTSNIPADSEEIISQIFFSEDEEIPVKKRSQSAVFQEIAEGKEFKRRKKENKFL